MASPDAESRGWRAPLRLSITRFIALAFFCQFLVAGGALLYVQQASKRTLAAAERYAAQELRDDLVATYRRGGITYLRRYIEQRLADGGDDRATILLADRSSRPIVGNLAAWPSPVFDKTSWRTIDLYRTGKRQPEPIGLLAERLPDGHRLLTGLVLTDSLRLADAYEEALSIAFLGSLILTFGIAIILGRILSRQVSAIAVTANTVAVGSLDERVRTDGSGDAFDRLGRSINAMLDRITALVEQLRMMTNGLAHDLKSPVTRLLFTVEQVSAGVQDEKALDALETVRREAELLQQMLSTALLISRTEAGFGADMMVSVDISQLLDDVAEMYEPLAEESGFALLMSRPMPGTFLLHRELVSQMLANLIENALKYAVGGSQILLSAEFSADAVHFIVSDNGPGIPEHRREEALRRFGRLDPARGQPGSGLGLSLTEAVARLHHGTIALENAEPGLRVVVTLNQPA